MDDLRHRLENFENTLNGLMQSQARSESRLEDVHSEVLRSRERLHLIEGDRSTIRLLTEQVRVIAEQVKTIVNEREAVAVAAAQKVVELERAQERREGRGLAGLRAQWTGVAITIASLSVAAIALFLK